MCSSTMQQYIKLKVVWPLHGTLLKRLELSWELVPITRPAPVLEIGSSLLCYIYVRCQNSAQGQYISYALHYHMRPCHHVVHKMM